MNCAVTQYHSLAHYSSLCVRKSNSNFKMMEPLRTAITDYYVKNNFLLLFFVTCAR